MLKNNCVINAFMSSEIIVLSLLLLVSVCTISTSCYDSTENVNVTNETCKVNVYEIIVDQNAYQLYEYYIPGVGMVRISYLNNGNKERLFSVYTPGAVDKSNNIMFVNHANELVSHSWVDYSREREIIMYDAIYNDNDYNGVVNTGIYNYMLEGVKDKDDITSKEEYSSEISRWPSGLTIVTFSSGPLKKMKLSKDRLGFQSLVYLNTNVKCEYSSLLYKDDKLYRGNIIILNDQSKKNTYYETGIDINRIKK